MQAANGVIIIICSLIYHAAKLQQFNEPCKQWHFSLEMQLRLSVNRALFIAPAVLLS